jgi:hypothetical protein
MKSRRRVGDEPECLQVIRSIYTAFECTVTPRAVQYVQEVR